MGAAHLHGIASSASAQSSSETAALTRLFAKRAIKREFCTVFTPFSLRAPSRRPARGLATRRDDFHHPRAARAAPHTVQFRSRYLPYPGPVIGHMHVVTCLMTRPRARRCDSAASTSCLCSARLSDRRVNSLTFFCCTVVQRDANHGLVVACVMTDSLALRDIPKARRLVGGSGDEVRRIS